MPDSFSLCFQWSKFIICYILKGDSFVGQETMTFCAPSLFFDDGKTIKLGRLLYPHA